MAASARLDARAFRPGEHTHALTRLEAPDPGLDHRDGAAAVQADHDLLPVLAADVALDRVARDASAPRTDHRGGGAAVAVADAVAEQAADRSSRDGAHDRAILGQPHRPHALDGAVGDGLHDPRLAARIVLWPGARAPGGKGQCRNGKEFAHFSSLRHAIYRRMSGAASDVAVATSRPSRRTGSADSPSSAAMVTRSGRQRAFIFRIILPRCAFTVISLMPSSPPTCLLSRPAATMAIRAVSRGLSAA